jgi:diguanylate cyclase (GGDEF)-like protein
MEPIDIRKTKFSITKKVSLLILGIVVLSVGSYALFAVWQFRDDKLKYVHLVNSRFTTTMGKKIQSTQENVLGDVDTMVTVMSSKSLDEERAQILKTLFQGNTAFISFSIYSYGPSAPPPPAAVADPGAPTAPAPTQTMAWNQIYGLTNRDLAQVNNITPEQIKAKDLQTIRDFLTIGQGKSLSLNRSQDPWSILAYPLDEQKKSIAIFFVSRDFMQEVVAESEISDVYVANRAGEVIVDSEGAAGRNVLNSAIFQLALENPTNEGGREFSEMIGETEKFFIGNFYKIGTDLILVSQADKKEAFAGMDKIIWNTILFAINITGIAILVGLLMSRSLTAPLRQLMTVSEDIAAGNYKLEIKVNSNDEVGQLADYFRLLGRKLDEREAELEKATELAIRDGMTGAYNHRHFRNRIADFFSLAKRGNRPLSLILTDIDFFKKFNDTYGHQQGDQVIKDIAKILQANARQTDFVARYGGEEFVVVLPDTDQAGAVQVAEKMRLAYQNHKIKNLTADGFISSTCSMGVATLNAAHNFAGTEDMIKHADENLYKAKKGGRNQTVA